MNAVIIHTGYERSVSLSVSRSRSRSRSVSWSWSGSGCRYSSNCSLGGWKWSAFVCLGNVYNAGLTEVYDN